MAAPPFWRRGLARAVLSVAAVPIASVFLGLVGRRADHPGVEHHHRPDRSTGPCRSWPMARSPGRVRFADRDPEHDPPGDPARPRRARRRRSGSRPACSTSAARDSSCWRRPRPPGSAPPWRPRRPRSRSPWRSVPGCSAGAAWGWIPGALKAFSGAHEVVTTIMLNSIAAAIVGCPHPRTAPGPGLLVRADRRPRQQRPPDHPRHQHPRSASSSPFAAVPAVWWLLYRSTLGFEIRSVGANPSAARYAGMRPNFLIMLTMSLSGLLFGIAGSTEILGVSHFMIPSYGTSIGFDAIAVALLGRSHPFGIAAAALLFGALRAGAGLDADARRDPSRDRRRHPGDHPALPGRRHRRPRICSGSGRRRRDRRPRRP